MATDYLSDDSLMPFGMHKGKKMQDVPIEYLHWFWNKNHDRSHPLNVYIKESLDGLKMENKDLIW